MERSASRRLPVYLITICRDGEGKNSEPRCLKKERPKVFVTLLQPCVKEDPRADSVRHLY